MSKKFGFDLLVQQAIDCVAEQASRRVANIIALQYGGDTPIERLLFAALCFRTEYDREAEWEWQVVVTGADIEKAIDACPRPTNSIFVQKQVEIPSIGRVDFFVHAFGDWAREGGPRPPCWRRLIIECDGHDFHERTKEQAAKDRSRDRAATIAGIDVLRFTGSEIWRDPWECAGQIITWANRAV
jgi:hypothetical protein